VAVAGGLTFSSISAGGWFNTCGLDTQGSAYCWGDNTYGELGDSTKTQRSSPVRVVGGITFAAISTGTTHTCGLTSAGSAYCWGANSAGQLGDGTTTDQTSPVAVVGGLTFATISAGAEYTCGVTTSGPAYCWGNNSSGQLGDGTQTGRTVPTPVAGGLNFASVATGGVGSVEGVSARAAHTCGVTTAGTAYCWGDNFYGQLGNGTSSGYGTGGTDSNAPVKVLGQP
jgi:alpha-tubulin suppressor-like RCC1 family protein